MRKTTMRGIFRPQLLATAVALGINAPAYAVNFSIGEIQGSFDSSLSLGSSWSVRAPDPDFISNFNSQGVRGNASARTSDDNRLNFKKGETFSKIFKGVHDLELKYGDSGAFVRGKYWYDFELMDESRPFYDIDDNGRQRAAKSSGAMFLDSFVYHNYTLDELQGNVRLGKQVVSWGESTFIGNSINSINPIDVAALRRPGAEVKEGLIPVNMLYVSQGLSENVTAEAFYQIEWAPSVLDNCGTFFGNDVTPEGCNDRAVIAGLDLPPGVATNTGSGLQVAGTAAQGGGVDDAYVTRTKTKDAKDSGQFGVALRWFAPDLNDTEFGAYFLNYHARNPNLDFTRATNIANTGAGAATVPGAINSIRTASYHVVYPEDIRLYGLSFSTNVDGTALAGEISFRPNMPLQLNGGDLNLAATGNKNSPLFISGASQNVAGAPLKGYERMPVLQTQLSATQFFDQVMGASRLTVVGEVGYNRINGLGEADGTDLRFGRSTIFGAGELATGPGAGATGPQTCAGAASQVPGAAAGVTRPSNPQQECNSHGFYTTDSWGYRLRGRLDYPNVFAGVNLAPNIAWSHDVEGNGPNFEEGLKAVSLGLDADYANLYTASLSYTDFFGGHFNTNGDRDYVALSVGVNF
ncbi:MULTISPECIES: DUF1302 domain-containing protein [unclassified Pseudomonas]|jgi:hypothetical protein|uniref:DUF1302 domain-containing protein n=1 Tax=unclassified Pseudomonas TaxID=196821 RepID=UPI00069EE8A2|nr:MULTISPECIES: DUF1302 domain-containing protein [unclassified Pseudomonas]WPN44706.1 DUF1302 domain-containing protein [Pseudomonas sp. P8_241]